MSGEQVGLIFFGYLINVIAFAAFVSIEAYPLSNLIAKFVALLYAGILIHYIEAVGPDDEKSILAKKTFFIEKMVRSRFMIVANLLVILTVAYSLLTYPGWIYELWAPTLSFAERLVLALMVFVGMPLSVLIGARIKARQKRKESHNKSLR